MSVPSGESRFVQHFTFSRVRNGSVRRFNFRLFGLLKMKKSPCNIVIVLCLQYALKGYPRKFLELSTPSHLTHNQVSYHSAESTEEIS